MIPVYHPTASITLYKTIKRARIGAGAPVSQRFQGVGSKIDLTPFLGDGSNVTTSKAIGQPAGSFSMFFADKPNGTPELGVDSLYGLIEPMDMVEICFTRSVPPAGGKPTVVMRGFISAVNRVEGVDGEGRPVRGVSVSGQDYGKLWQMLQILLLPGYVIGQDMITAFKLFERFSVGFKTTMSCSEFITEVMEKIVLPYLKRLMPETSMLPATMKLEVAGIDATTSVTGPQNQEGTIYSLLQSFLDVGVWNELFIEDRDDAVYCVYRPNPYTDLSGALIQKGARDPGSVVVSSDDIVAFNVGRTDANVANYYWVRGPRFDLNTDLYRKQWAADAQRDTVLLGDYENADEDLYGIRAMFVDSQTGGPAVTTFNSGLPKADLAARDDLQKDWLDERRRVLVEQNKDNVVLESGTSRIKGNEKLRPGMNMVLQRGQFSASYYVTAMRHTFIPYQGFFTDLTLERGRGFIERASREGGAASPYYAEMAR